jgi:hypothetical protein
LQKQANDQHWELKGQLLILAANILTQFNSDAMAESMSKQQLDPVSENKEIKSRASGSARSKRSEGIEPVRINKETVSKNTTLLFNMIHAIFNHDAPKVTQKIGLIYLAKIIDFYPEFTDKYLEILLSSPENIRSSTLEMEPLRGTEEEVYVSGAYTEKYRTFGAP